MTRTNADAAPLRVYEWERLEYGPGRVVVDVDQCEDMHDTLAAARECANTCWAEYQPTRLVAIDVMPDGTMEAVQHYGFRPATPRDFVEAFAWGRV
jgi:hypothetical protein